MEFKINNLETAPEEAKASLEKVRKAYGFVPNLIGVFSNSPEAAEAYLKVSELFESTSLSPLEKQIVLIASSVENECTYCVAAHTVISGLQKLPDEVIAAIREKRPIADEKLEALRLFASEVTATRGLPSEETVRRFKEVGYTEKHALEVLVGVTQKTLSNYVNHLAGTPLDEAFAAGEWNPKAESIATA